MDQLRRHLHAAHGLNVWYATAMGLCGCLGLLLLGFISYWCFKLRQDSRRRRSVVLLSNRNSYESSHLLQRASLDWPSSMTTSSMMTLPLSSSSTSLYLSPIPEELRSMCSEDDEFDDFNRDKEFVQDFCDQSEDYVWLDKPALYMGKNRLKRMYLLGRATSSLAQLTSRGRLGGGGESKHVLCSLFPTTAAAMQAEDLSALRAFFHYVQEQCPHVLPVLGIHLMPSADKVMVLTPYVPQGSLKDYIYHRCKTAVVQIPYHHKYRRHSTGKPVGHSTLARYGRDILVGMLELQHAGLAYPQLQSGNVLLHGDQATLSGYEASFFQPESPQDVSPVTLFGRVFFEMVFGCEWTASRLNPDGTVAYGTLQPPTDHVLLLLCCVF
ncbi:SLOB protein kinase, variant [Aphanomyces astaci]|uniref:SLOB protein kinase, variant n=1 Tax=Aphanomyces astaci TaxID=112090 RepID=W4FTZ4_APHAT|nr:SLOB protein kinase, variant [Aphanomyces astaci]ETV70299.1 SLOB protein kinase, variant [Aphanomyces astaci]|eukprot:XP_009840257.1 SLOB protein kinase, variant [Aphanomyces astaci]